MNGARFVMLGMLCALSGLASATDKERPGGLPDAAPAPSVIEPIPFAHSVHSEPFDKVGLTCVHCHPVGARKDDTQVSLPKVPLSSCHGCHLNALPGAPRQADPTCTTCHADRAQLVPKSHGLDWVGGHGPDARTAMKQCSSCHQRGMCVDCHEGRGAMSRSPHPPAFGSTHGVEARLDPASCSTCHAEQTCTSCHITGVTPW
ncbi:MAG: hypothetical protein ACI9MC_001799 [Kiritimatiellia bacterium]|jgi:hypothetical protein